MARINLADGKSAKFKVNKETGYLEINGVVVAFLSHGGTLELMPLMSHQIERLPGIETEHDGVDVYIKAVA